MPHNDKISSSFWDEMPEPDNPFMAQSCHCHGYDVYGDLLGKVGWLNYFYLLLTGERLSEKKQMILETAAVAIANPGPRDPSVRGAMNGAIGGSQAAACLMSALAIGAGQSGGAHEVYLAMQMHNDWSRELSCWQIELPKYLQNAAQQEIDAWPLLEHIPGFDPNAVRASQVVLRLFQHILPAELITADYSSYKAHENEPVAPNNALNNALNNASTEFRTTQWLWQTRSVLEEIIGYPLGLTGLISAIFIDLGLTPLQGEMLYMILRLPGAAAHALDQTGKKFHEYPFFSQSLDILNDPQNTSHRNG